jgi:hypothetical protein
MKSSLVRSLMITAAALALSAAANAQEKLVADVPFAFHAAGRTLPSGQYTVGRYSQGSTMAIAIRNTRNSHQVFVLTTPMVKTIGSSPRLTFRCGEVSGCTLAEAWGANGYGWKLANPRLKPAEKELIAEIPLRRSAE